MLSLSKSKRLVGLDIETGSIAATEVQANGHTALAGYGLMPLDTGIFREGEVADPGALGEALKELFAKEKLSKAVRLGIANQRVAVRTIRLPRIEDRGELETAIRFQAQDHIPMPLEQAVLDWQAVPLPPEGDGEAQMDVVVVAARRDMVDGILEATRRAGLRLTGIDHSAFGMIRALTGEPAAAVGAAAYVHAPTAVESGLGPEVQVPQGDAPPLRAPRRRSSSATSPTSPTWRSPGAPRACSPGSARSGWRASPSPSRSAAGSRSSMPDSG